MVDLAKLLQAAAAHRQAENWPAAEQAYREILEHVPAESAVRRDLAWLLQRRGEHAAAIEQLTAAVQSSPDFAALYVDLGTMLGKAGRNAEAAARFQQALALEPANLVARYNLANAYQRLRQFELAVESYTAALQLAADDADIYLNLGVAQRELGQLAEAKRSFEQVLRLKPDSADAWLNLGGVARMDGNESEAVACFRRAIQRNPRFAAAYNSLGRALRACNDLAPAIDAFRQALRINPNDGTAMRSLGNAYESEGRTTQAVACFAEAARLLQSDGLKIKCALTLPVILESIEQIEQRREQLARDLRSLAGQALHVSDPAQSVGAPAFALAYQGRNERDFQSQIAALLRRASPELACVAPHCAARERRSGRRRVKIGFISSHFRAHTIGKLNVGLIEQLNRDEFEVVVFRFPRPADAMSQRIAQSADVCVTLPSDLSAARSQIAQHELDVLYYTDVGIDGLTYYLAHARLAPVQCVTWGHPLTTGIETLDYFISSEDLEPADGQAHYTEALVRLPHLTNYYFRPDPPEWTKTRADFGLAESAHVYACLQSLFKLHPDDDALFAAILRRDPHATLLLLEGQFPNWTELIRRRFRESIPDVADRISFVSHQAPPDFSRLLATVDVLLDPLHFGGGDTSYQSFAVGTPIVTLPGSFLRSRITYALYHAMGLSDCIAVSTDDYVERAVRLGTDRAWNRQVRDSILSANRTIYENGAAVREFEAFLIQAVAGTSKLP